jgi:hypothetical protein
MEALMEREEAEMSNWNDDRLDELSGRVDEGFREMRESFAQAEARNEAQFARVNSRLDQLIIVLIIFAGGLIGTLTVALLANG